MKKLNLGYFTTFALIVSGINTGSLIASVKPSVTDEVAVENTGKNSRGVDSVFVNTLNTSTAYHLTLVKPMDGSNLGTFLKEKIRYPDNALNNNVEGVVLVKVRVDGNGFVSDVKAVESADGDLTSEVIKAVEDLRFQPILQNGYPASYNLILPVKFELIK
jgi:TonB family protein